MVTRVCATCNQSFIRETAKEADRSLNTHITMKHGSGAKGRRKRAALPRRVPVADPMIPKHKHRTERQMRMEFITDLLSRVMIELNSMVSEGE